MRISVAETECVMQNHSRPGWSLGQRTIEAFESISYNNLVAYYCYCCSTAVHMVHGNKVLCYFATVTMEAIRQNRVATRCGKTQPASICRADWCRTHCTATRATQHQVKYRIIQPPPRVSWVDGVPCGASCVDGTIQWGRQTRDTQLLTDPEQLQREQRKRVHASTLAKRKMMQVSSKPSASITGSQMAHSEHLANTLWFCHEIYLAIFINLL
jgi:hypothetical protein